MAKQFVVSMKIEGDASSLKAAADAARQAVDALGSDAKTALGKMTPAVNDNTKALELNRGGMMELRAAGINTFQALAAGMDPFQVAMMEGSQVVGAFVQGTEGGLKGLISTLGGGALRAIANPIGAITAGLTAAGLAVLAYEKYVNSGIPSVDEALKEHKAIIDEITASYPEAAKAAKQYEEEAKKLPRSVVSADASEQAEKSTKSYERAIAQIQSFIRLAETQIGQLGQSGISALRQVDDLISSGQVDAERLSEIVGGWRTDPGLNANMHEFARTIQDAANKAAELEASLAGSRAAMDALVNAPVLKKGARPNSTDYLIEQLGLGERAMQPGLADLAEKLGQQQIPGVSIPTPTPRPSLLDYDPTKTKKSTSAYKSATQSLADRTRTLEAQARAQAALNPAVEDYGYAIDKAQASQQLLNAAMRDQKQITPALLADIEKQADGYATAASAREEQRKAEQKAAEQLRQDKGILKGALSTYIGDLQQGKSAWEALGDAATNALDRIIDKLENDWIDAILSPGKTPSTGGAGLLGWIGKILGFGGSASSSVPVPTNPGTTTPIGFDRGGYTGNGGIGAIAGFVHGREYVFDAASTAAIGVGNLEAIRRRALGGYQDGGYVSAHRPALFSPAANQNGPRVILNIQNHGEPVQEEDVRESHDADGNLTIDAVVRPIVRDETLTSGRRTNRQLMQMGLQPPMVRR